MDDRSRPDNPNEEENMSANSRRAFLMSLVIPFTVSACGPKNESEQVAKQFMEAYYVKMDTKAASEMSSGLAADKLKQQLALLQGVAPDSASDKPQVDVRLASTPPAGAADEASYIFEVHSNAQDIGGRKVFVKVRQEGGKWRVSQFTEEFQGMPQAPSPPAP